MTNARKYKPGPGWKMCEGPSYQPNYSPVSEHVSGLRIHVTGIALLPNGKVIWGERYPESVTLDRFIRINGGNRRRGVMAWAKQLSANVLTPPATIG